jgi:hypothetical protein
VLSLDKIAGEVSVQAHQLIQLLFAADQRCVFKNGSRNPVGGYLPCGCAHDVPDFGPNL